MSEMRGYERKEHTVHHILLRMRLWSCAPLRVPMLIPVYHWQLPSELDNGVMENDGRGWWITFSFHITFLEKRTWHQDVLWDKDKPGWSSVLLWTMFCGEILGPGIHMDVTLTRPSYLTIVADHVYDFLVMVSPIVSVFFQRDNASPCTKWWLVWGTREKVHKTWFGRQSPQILSWTRTWF